MQHIQFPTLFSQFKAELKKRSCDSHLNGTPHDMTRKRSIQFTLISNTGSADFNNTLQLGLQVMNIFNN